MWGKKYKGITVRRINPFQKAMIQATEELNKGLIKTEDYRERLDDILKVELSKEITDIREESEVSLLRGVLAGASFGVLGSLLSGAFFYNISESTDLSIIILIISLIGFSVSAIYIFYVLDRYIKHKPKIDYWTKIKRKLKFKKKELTEKK